MTTAASPSVPPPPVHAGGKIPSPWDDEVARAIVLATQGGLPLVPRPYHAVAAKLGLEPQIVMDYLRTMAQRGVVRRIAAVPNHYALGYRGNGMSVWDVTDEHLRDAGKAVGALDFVSHCYHRPRRPGWRYNLFAMVHGRDRGAVDTKVAAIAELLGERARAHEVLFSKRILKKTGLRLSAEDADSGRGQGD